MFPRDADVRRALRRYPDVTCAERQALRSWYQQADVVELMTALSDPSLERPLARLRCDHPQAGRTGLIALPALLVPLLLLILVAALI